MKKRTTILIYGLSSVVYVCLAAAILCLMWLFDYLIDKTGYSGTMVKDILPYAVLVAIAGLPFFIKEIATFFKVLFKYEKRSIL